MNKVNRLFFSITVLYVKLMTAQVMRQPQFNFINRPDTIMDGAGNFLNGVPGPTVLSEPPCNSVVPIPNVVNPPSTTIITDCSPTICKNLANTIQLMIVSNLLQNTQDGSEFAMKLAGPIINEVMSSPAFACPCENSVASELFSSNIISPNIFAPSLANRNMLPSNVGVYSPGQSFLSPMAQSLGTPVGQNIMTPNFLPLSSRVMSGLGPNNMLPSNMITGVPTRVTNNVPLNKPTNGILNSIIGILGNVQGQR